jgi:glutathione synthase/RimK-type ligase-like ATP-grasp enzyme
MEDSRILWLRSASSNQILDYAIEDETARLLINSDSVGGLTGLLATHFHGKWISDREATYRAADKIGQLQVAYDCGFRVPRTLVSQSRDDVKAFYEACDGNIIVKTIVGAPGPLLQTVPLSDPSMTDEDAFAAAPAIYQECVRGCDHLRLNCFGPRSFAALIRTDDLDWRINLNVPIASYPVPDRLHHHVRAVLDRLGLDMGIVDLKLTPEGEPVWLEVNPQGQFLFLDALTDLNLAKRFAEYLMDEHRNLVPK